MEHTAVQMLLITAWKLSVAVLFISIAQRGASNICGRWMPGVKTQDLPDGSVGTPTGGKGESDADPAVMHSRAAWMIPRPISKALWSWASEPCGGQGNGSF